MGGIPQIPSRTSATGGSLNTAGATAADFDGGLGRALQGLSGALEGLGATQQRKNNAEEAERLADFRARGARFARGKMSEANQQERARLAALQKSEDMRNKAIRDRGELAFRQASHARMAALEQEYAANPDGTLPQSADAIFEEEQQRVVAHLQSMDASPEAIAGFVADAMSHRTDQADDLVRRDAAARKAFIKDTYESIADQFKDATPANMAQFMEFREQAMSNLASYGTHGGTAAEVDEDIRLANASMFENMIEVNFSGTNSLTGVALMNDPDVRAIALTFMSPKQYEALKQDRVAEVDDIPRLLTINEMASNLEVSTKAISGQTTRSELVKMEEAGQIHPLLTDELIDLTNKSNPHGDIVEDLVSVNRLEEHLSRLRAAAKSDDIAQKPTVQDTVAFAAEVLQMRKDRVLSESQARGYMQQLADVSVNTVLPEINTTWGIDRAMRSLKEVAGPLLVSGTSGVNPNRFGKTLSRGEALESARNTYFEQNNVSIEQQERINLAIAHRLGQLTEGKQEDLSSFIKEESASEFASKLVMEAARDVAEGIDPAISILKGDDLPDRVVAPDGSSMPMKPAPMAAPVEREAVEPRAIPQRAVEFLRQNPTPEIIADFDDRYGVGAAQKVLGG